MPDPYFYAVYARAGSRDPWRFVGLDSSEQEAQKKTERFDAASQQTMIRRIHQSHFDARGQVETTLPANWRE